MQQYQIIEPRFLLDRQRGELTFDGQQFHVNGSHYLLASLVAMKVQYRLLGPLLLLLALAPISYYLLDLLGQLFTWLGQIFPWLRINPPTGLNGGRPFLILLAPIMAFFFCTQLQPFSYLQLKFSDREPLSLANYSGLLDQLQLQPRRPHRRALTIATWLLLSLALFSVQWPRWQAPTADFPICIQGESGPQLQSVGGLNAAAELCTPPLAAPIDGDGLSFNLDGGGDYRLLTVQPLESGALEYHYRVNNGTVQPLQWREAESAVALALLMLTYSAPLTALLYLLWRSLLVRRHLRQRFAAI